MQWNRASNFILFLGWQSTESSCINLKRERAHPDFSSNLLLSQEPWDLEGWRQAEESRGGFLGDQGSQGS